LWEEFGHTPVVFVRVASKGLTGYGTWKSAQRIENTGFAEAVFVQESEQRRRIEKRWIPHPALSVNADPKGVTGAIVCKNGF
jgi:hypothetical protein